MNERKRSLKNELRESIDNLFKNTAEQERVEQEYQQATKKPRRSGGDGILSPNSRASRPSDEGGPRLELKLIRLKDGRRVDCEDLAGFIQFSLLGSSVDKPKFVDLSQQRSILQTLVVRINVEDSFFKSTNLSFPNEFFEKQWIEMDADISDRNIFWKSILNVSLSLKERIRRKSEKMQETFEQVGLHDKAHFVLSTEQLANRKFPFPGEENIVPTKTRYHKLTSTSPLFSIDCEMCETDHDQRELTRISIIDEQERTLLDTLVKPHGEITNYLTQYSGITAEMMETATASLQDVQKAVQSLLPPDAILVGHSLEHDLQAMKMTHPYCFDVGHMLNLTNDQSGLRNSLKNLSEKFLGETIQNSFGHCSYEDAWAALRLAQLKIEKGIVFGNTSYGWKSAEYLNVMRMEEEAEEKVEDVREELVAAPCSACSQPTVVGCSIKRCRCRFVMAPTKCIQCVKEGEIIEGDFDWKETLPSDKERTDSPIEGYLEKEKLKTIMCAFEKTTLDFPVPTTKKMHSKLPSSFSSHELFLDDVAAGMLNDNLILTEIDKEKLSPLESCGEEGEIQDNSEVLNRKLEKLVAATAKRSLVMLVFSSSQKNILYVRVK